MIAPPWLHLLDETIGLCLAHERGDLADRLRYRRARLLAPKLHVLVIGAAKQGKSQLVNALVNASVCAVGDDLTTVAPTVIQHAEEPSAVLVTDRAAGVPRALPGGPSAAFSLPDRLAIPIEEVARQTSGKADPALRGDVVTAEVGIPRQLLAAGLVLIDTPPADLANRGAARTGGRKRSAVADIDQADTVVLVSDATCELSGTELELLADAVKSCPSVLIALTKIDLSPRWRTIAERNRSRLSDLGLAAKMVPVSATLRLLAAQTGDKQLNTESGFAELISCLQRDVLAKPDSLARRGVALVAGTAIAEVVGPLRAGLSEPDPNRSAAAVATLRAAQQTLEDVRRHSSRWQTVLSDETSDLVADIEYDLRERTRKILREADRAFETADPQMTWTQFEDWLMESLTESANANYGWLLDRFRWMAEKVAHSVPMPRGETMPESIAELPEDRLGIDEPETPRLEPFTLGQKAFTALRSSYGGVLMFGLATSLAGLPLINPISLGAGVAFGGKGIRDESEGRLKRRQAAARTAAQRHIDDFYLAFTKDCKDMLRHAQRRLRDHFLAVTEAVQDEALATAEAARQSIQSDAVAADVRNREIQRDLEKLVNLYQRLQALAATALPARANGLEITA
ncbi:MAG TPA: dynamin family protein [Pseudonocardiaceae bacterium]|nr:dynamin family protein [Pseudonocardiaceae bacterium]